MLLLTNKYRRLITALAGLGAFALVLIAWLYLEKVLYLMPCPLCMVQRLAFVIAGVFFILDAIVWNQGKIIRLFAQIGKFGGIFFGIALAARHLAIIYAPEDKKPKDCGFDFYALIDKEGWWSGLLRSMQGTGDCASVDPFLGLAVPTWSMIGFIGLLLVAVIFGKAKK